MEEIFSIHYKDQALKSLSEIPQTYHQRIVSGISGLKITPYIGKKLRGKLIGKYSLRIWPYRVLYQIKKKEITIIILDIGHRQRIYG